MSFFSGNKLGEPAPTSRLEPSKRTTADGTIVGTGVPIGTKAAADAAALIPAPAPGVPASAAQGGAKTAAERQRKRATAAGALAGGGARLGGPAASLNPMSLIGGS